MARLYLLVALLAVIAAAVFWEMQYDARRQLSSQSDAMRQQFKRFEQLEADNVRLSNMVARFDTPLSDEQLAEMANLRQQIETLRRSTNELATLRTQVKQLRAALDGVKSTAGPPPDVPSGDIYPREAWNFAGYDTPENTIQSLMWAVSQGDEDTYAAGLTPDMFTEMQGQFADGSFADEAPLEMSDITGYRIVDRGVDSDGNVRVILFMDGPNELMPIDLQPTQNGWMVAATDVSAQ